MRLIFFLLYCSFQFEHALSVTKYLVSEPINLVRSTGLIS